MIMEYVEVNQISGVKYEVNHVSGADLGTIEMDVDGFFYYWPTNRSGCWSSSVMREIADKLDEINTPMNDDLEKYFDAMVGNPLFGGMVSNED